MEKCREVTATCFANPDCYAIKYCVIDKVGSRAECMERYPKGKADFEMWSTCGVSTGCFSLIGTRNQYPGLQFETGYTHSAQ